MLLKFPTTKTHFTFSAPAAQLIAAEMSQAHEQRTPFYLKGLGRFFILIPTSLPCGARKKKEGERRKKKERKKRKAPPKIPMAAL